MANIPSFIWSQRVTVTPNKTVPVGVDIPLKHPEVVVLIQPVEPITLLSTRIGYNLQFGSGPAGRMDYPTYLDELTIGAYSGSSGVLTVPIVPLNGVAIQSRGQSTLKLLAINPGLITDTQEYIVQAYPGRVNRHEIQIRLQDVDSAIFVTIPKFCRKLMLRSPPSVAVNGVVAGSGVLEFDNSALSKHRSYLYSGVNDINPTWFQQWTPVPDDALGVRPISIADNFATVIAEVFS